jgi:hypothetical protein
VSSIPWEHKTKTFIGDARKPGAGNLNDPGNWSDSVPPPSEDVVHFDWGPVDVKQKFKPKKLPRGPVGERRQDPAKPKCKGWGRRVTEYLLGVALGASIGAGATAAAKWALDVNLFSFLGF